MTRKERIRRKAKRILIGLGLLILVSLTAYGGEKARGWALAEGQFAVEEVAVIGNVYLSQEEVESLHETSLRGVNLLKIDPEAVAERIAAGEWIETARVKRVPPARLEINIK
ncbi:MAG: FtsQ-type POTRA domain-containing protein, partial [Gemmatimonadetes bacterium]|nr:FtsQ-type POTRA domain-containing protein [Gemmatimonadota bacterium]